jgi:hypothetical protein
VRATLTLAGGALALFHLWLFAGRLRDLSIVEPRVLAAWLASAALGLFALFLQRRGLPLASGRSGLVFWLCVLLLHVGLVPAVPALPSAEAALGLGLQLAAGALAVAGAVAAARRAAADARPARAWALELAPHGAVALGACGPLAVPRPPPSR